MSSPLRRHAVVVGAGIAGLATARTLSDHFEQVTVLERDELPAAAGPRRGVPQGRHAHALLSGGARAIAEMFPGIMEDLVGRGAALIEFNKGRWFQAGGYRASCLIERKVISASRPFIEQVVRERVEALPNVRIDRAWPSDAARRRGPSRAPVFDGSISYAIEADLVVDCTGRASRGGLWMEELGYAAPRVVDVECQMRYATVILPRRTGDLGVDFSITIESPPHGKRAAFVMPIEGDRWIATIAAGYGASAPTDEEGFRAAAATLPAPELDTLLRGMGDLGPVATHRLISSKRRRYEKLKDVPAGFLALGDSVCSFNPIYGQGMSSAVLQAVALGECLAAYGNGGELVKAFYRRAAKVIATPWQIAVSADFAIREHGTRSRSAPTSSTATWARAHRGADLARGQHAMILVQNLLASPSTLLRPSMVRTVGRPTRGPPPPARPRTGR
jgi:2-polyprenyl-6-methoxyphenol hydroxylase-like FAD-dependent oxidoreductase